MRLAAADGVRYHVTSGGTGPAILLLHGFTGRGREWASLGRALRAGGRTTVAADLLGHGSSDAPASPARHALERQAADLLVILERLGALPAAVLGYSFGARLALALAAGHPRAVSALVLESPSAGIADPAERAARVAADEALADRIERDGVEAFVDTWWETSPVFASERGLPARTRARLRRARLRNRPEGLARSLRGAGQGAMTPLHGRLAAIAAPVLVVAGDLDPTGLARATDVRAGLPDARLAVIEGAGHAAHRERPVAFRRTVLDFLQEVQPA